MSEIFKNAAAVLLILGLLFGLYKQLQMLQQNSYFPSRYFKWVKESHALRLVISAFAFFLFSFLYTMGLYLYMFALSAVLLIVKIISAVRTHKRSVKPLVFTKRIVRLYAATAVINVVLCLIAILCKPFVLKEAAFIIMLFLCLMPVPTCLISWLVTFPIEKLFNRYYINDAKKILSSVPDLTVIGITGSYGKTTTKFILTRILSERFNTLCTPSSFNTTLGIVRTVREKMKPQTEVFVCEMGAKNIGDVKEICDIVNPKLGIITSVGAQHLETFKSVDNVFKAKFELCDSIEKNGGTCFAFLGSKGIAERKKTKPYCTYFGDGTDYYADNISISPSGTSFDLHLKGETVTVHTKLLGKHAVYDILSAAAVAHTLGVSEDDIKIAVNSLKATKHRLELKRFFAGSLLIDDAYNSNPEGCLEALNVLGSFDGMRKVVITPGLIELGDKEYECNYNLGLACAKNADDIILVGRNRSKPMAGAVNTTNFDLTNLHIVSSFKEGLDIYRSFADSSCVLLIENDLPDNYLN